MSDGVVQDEALEPAEPVTFAGSAADRQVTEADTGFRFGEGVVTLSAPGSERAETIGALRTHIMAQHLAAGRRSLALCSPSAGTGCSALAVNLAVALAEGGVRTLLIDADMRRPSLPQFIAPSHDVIGLSDCLADDTVAFGDAIQFEVQPDLSLIYAGSRTDRPQDLLASGRFQQLADLCLREYDMTIVDTPPSNSSADARRIAAVMHYALIVVRRNLTFLSDVKLLTEELVADQATVIGSVLNLG